MRLDLVSNDAGELVRRERSRELGTEVVLAVYRLLRLARMHDSANKAFVSQLEQTHALVADYGMRADGHVNVLFAQRAVFVAGQLLKGSRQVYEAAAELGDMLEWCGGAELTIQRDVTIQELKAFAEAVAQALRIEKARQYRSTSPKIRLRPVNDLARLRGLDLEDLTEEQRIVRTYATAVVIMRRLFEDLSGPRLVLPRRVKRIAQKLVDLSAGTTPAFLGITEMRNANHDDAGRAVNGAILAVSMARQLTEDRTLLAQIAMAAMLHDVGRPRAAAIAAGDGPRMEGVQAYLTDDAEDEVAAGTAAVLTALGRLNEATITRTVIAFEAQWLRRAASLGAPYRGVRAPTLQARMIAVARRFNDLLIPEPGLTPPPSDFAIATLWKELTDPTDRVVVRLLASALRLFPVGTVVGLSTGEVAAVVPGGDRDAGSAKPRVRIVMDALGNPLDRTIEVDLAHPGIDEPPRTIVKILSVDGWAKGLSLQPRTDGDEAPRVEPMPWEREGVKPPSISRIIAAPVAPPPVPAARAASATPLPASSFDAARAAALSAPFDSRPSEPARPRGAIAPPFEPRQSEPPRPRGPIAPPFDLPPSPPTAAVTARARATPPPPVSERVTPSSRRMPIGPLGKQPTPPPAGPPATGPMERAKDIPARLTPQPITERVAAPTRPVRSTPTPSGVADGRASVPPPPMAPPGRPPTPRTTTHPPAENEDGPVRWGRRLEDFPSTPAARAPTPRPATAAEGARASSTPPAPPAVASSAAPRLVPPELVPSAHGTLGVTPLAHILVYMLDNRATGTVSFHEPDGWEHVVAVHEGAPAMVKTERPMALLGNELVSKGFIGRDVMLRAVDDARRSGVMLGEHLVRAGVIKPNDLGQALEAQVGHKVSGLANLPEGTRYAFYPSRNFLEDWAGGELYPADPLSTILDSVRSWMDRVRILGTLSRIGAQPLVLHPDADLGSLQLSVEESTVLSVIRTEGLPLAHLFDRQVADVEIVRSIVYMLAITRQFEFSRDRGVPLRGGRPAPPPRPARKRVTGAPPAPVADAARPVPVAPPPTPRQIPISIALTPLPLTRDTLPAPSSAPPPPVDPDDLGYFEKTDHGSLVDRDALLAIAEEIAERLDSTSELPPREDVVEIDDDGFGDEAPSPAGGDDSPAERFLQAMNDFRLAQDALQRGDMAEAEMYAERAVEADPGNGDQLALLAWIRAKDAPIEQLEDPMFLLGQVLQEEPTLLRARLYRGRLHKRSERWADALRDFEAVLEVNPRHREAMSEVKFLRGKV